jgi:transposase-like protein
MAQAIFTAEHFQNEEAAFAFLEARIWPNGPVCVHCGAGAERIRKLAGKTTRVGLWKCYSCGKPFTVKVGTVFEASHVKLHLWLQAMHLMCSSKKGVSSHQLHRTLGVTLKTAWFMSHRLREALRVIGMEPMGGEGAIVEADETYIGRKAGTVKRRGHEHKRTVVALVERGGSVRSFHVDKATVATVGVILRENVSPASRLMTDESGLYMAIGAEYADHQAVNHSQDEYVRGEAHTQTIDGYFSVFKRGMKGIYQHCAEKHLHRYLTEFDFRYNHRIRLGIDDCARTDAGLKGAVGKRLTYRTTKGEPAAHWFE